jgi:hypothetical protein
MLVIGVAGAVNFQFHSLNSVFSPKAAAISRSPRKPCIQNGARTWRASLKSIDPDEPHFHAIGAGGVEYAAHAEKMEYANGDPASSPMLAKGGE